MRAATASRLQGQPEVSDTLVLPDGELAEICSLTGTVHDQGSHSHLHMTVARADGSCLGGHVLEGCIVFSTAEVVLVSLQRTVFTRSLDPSTGYHELMISTS